MHESESVSSVAEQPAAQSWPAWIPAVFLTVSAVTSVFTVLRRVLGGSQFQIYDYWAILSSSVSPNGSFNWGTLLLLQNEHPVATARLLYFANARLFDGSNRSLGLAVAALAAAQVVLVISALRRSGEPRLYFVGAFAVAVLFTPSGIHSFQLSMSGSAWLTANLFSILAIWLVLGDRTYSGVVAALAASASYGTGLMVWPALAALVALSGDRRLIRHLPIAAGWILSWVTYLFLYDRPAGHGGFGLDLGGIGFRALSVLGSSLSSDSTIATLFGAMGLGLLTWLFANADSSLARRPTIGTGLCIYALGAAVLIGFSRTEFGISIGVSSRYVSISAVFVVGLFALALGRSERWLPVSIAVGFLAAVGGQATLSVYDRLQADADEAAVAVRLGNGAQYFPTFDPAALAVVRALEHYPLNGEFDLACGMLGDLIPTSEIGDGGIVGTVSVSPQQRDPLLVRGEGTLRQLTTGAKCVLAVAPDGLVVGAGAIGFAPSTGSEREGDVGFTVLVPVDSQDAGVVVVGEDGELYAIEGDVRLVEAAS